ncbi:MAG: nucleoside deaminase [bacterium]|nr:nucleoside deaminase [bacterium]
MERALAQAHLGAEKQDVPVGAVLVFAGEIIAEAHNEIVQNNDPTAHAELLVIRRAAKKLGAPRLVGAHLYVTLEPCPMCAQAIAFARIEKVTFGAYDPKGGGVDHGPKIFEQPTCHHDVQIVGGILEKECSQILKDFFQMRRKNI